MQVFKFYIQSSSEQCVRNAGYQTPAIVRVTQSPSVPNRITDPVVVVENGRVFASAGFSVVSQAVKWFPHTVRLGKARLWQVTLDRLAEMEKDALYPHVTINARWTQARNLDVLSKLMTPLKKG